MNNYEKRLKQGRAMVRALVKENKTYDAFKIIKETANHYDVRMNELTVELILK
jgi:hypothetical protein